jgi:hypothetical protein
MKRMVEADGGQWVARLLREHVQKKLKTSFSSRNDVVSTTMAHRMTYNLA